MAQIYAAITLLVLAGSGESAWSTGGSIVYDNAFGTNTVRQTGGVEITVSSNKVFLGGGDKNTVTGGFAVVLGGGSNKASGTYAAVGAV